MRIVTGLIILVCVVSRAIEMPVYLSQLDFISLSDRLVLVLRWLSRGVLFTGGVVGMLYVLKAVWGAYRRRQEVQSVLRQSIRQSEGDQRT